MDPKQKRDEAQFREIEKALLWAEDAGAKIGKIAKQLRKEGADTDLVTAVEAGSEAIRAEHRADDEAGLLPCAGQRDERLSMNDYGGAQLSSSFSRVGSRLFRATRDPRTTASAIEWSKSERSRF